MSIFKDKPNQIKDKVELRDKLTPQQISDGKPHWQAFMKCLKEHGIEDEEILYAIRQNVSKRVLHDSSLFKF